MGGFITEFTAIILQDEESSKMKVGMARQKNIPPFSPSGVVCLKGGSFESLNHNPLCICFFSFPEIMEGVGGIDSVVEHQPCVLVSLNSIYSSTKISKRRMPPSISWSYFFREGICPGGLGPEVIGALSNNSLQLRQCGRK